jgi:hypothetical protein
MATKRRRAKVLRRRMAIHSLNFLMKLRCASFRRLLYEFSDRYAIRNSI